MSFIIKGFDTDGNCLHCYFQSEDSDRCILTDDDIPLYGKGHPDSCPLVPIPEGHGRLIDADALICEGADISDGYWVGEYCEATEWGYSTKMIENAPTIVPAEGDGEMSEPVKDYPPYLDYPKPRKKQTNADRIRAMTDEEMAKFLCATHGTCANWCPISSDCDGNDCDRGLLDWLREDVISWKT